MRAHCAWARDEGDHGSGAAVAVGLLREEIEERHCGGGGTWAGGGAAVRGGPGRDMSQQEVSKK